MFGMETRGRGTGLIFVVPHHDPMGHRGITISARDTIISGAMCPAPTAEVTFIVILATVAIGGRMKVSELKPGMLLRFKTPRIYKFLRDSNNDYWLDCGKLDPRQTLKWVHQGQPLMIYLGQRKMEDPSYYGGFYNVREVSVDGQVAWMWPDAWRYVEAV